MSKKHDTKKFLYQNECVLWKKKTIFFPGGNKQSNKIDFHFTFVFCSMHGPDAM